MLGRGSISLLLPDFPSPPPASSTPCAPPALLLLPSPHSHPQPPLLEGNLPYSLTSTVSTTSLIPSSALEAETPPGCCSSPCQGSTAMPCLLLLASKPFCRVSWPILAHCTSGNRAAPGDNRAPQHPSLWSSLPSHLLATFVNSSMQAKLSASY